MPTSLDPSATSLVVPDPDSVRPATDRAAMNRENAQHSTGPRTDAGKQRSSANALRHGLTAASPVLPTEDPDAFRRHVQQFLDEYKPANPTETHLVHELANTAWRLDRIPLLEAGALARAADVDPDSHISIGTEFDIVATTHRLVVNLGIHSSRLSRQFHKTLQELRQIQAERRQQEKRDLQDAAALLVLHKKQRITWQPADDGFVFSKEEVDRHARHLMRLDEARHLAPACFNSTSSNTRPSV